MTHLYVYYRVIDHPASQSRLADFIRQVAQQTGQSGTLLRKLDDPATWMESYENIADRAQFSQQLACLAEQADFAALLMPGSRRHEEWFEVTG
ncbi:dTDP-4-dehydrorhamnose reductase [Chitinivorax tropicus]|uniref:dTDP-4-dehydrorhamnose reductase n=1 Tax=Chitinivorax tropicus TaxID=714531 RepID=A0A840MK52_9PROT|nr:DUF4936 family protein [Chitinivorax tropicus]MBB5018780.1 dTDP-4-dehydrorhamnose reductase [Chitinivorax tropicus]